MRLTSTPSRQVTKKPRGRRPVISANCEARGLDLTPGAQQALATESAGASAAEPRSLLHHVHTVLALRCLNTKYCISKWITRIIVGIFGRKTKHMKYPNVPFAALLAYLASATRTL